MAVLLLILAHLLADFTFQTSTMAAEKAKYKKYFWLHIGIHFLLYEAAFIVLSFSLHSYSLHLFYAGVCLAVLHLAIDFTKEKFRSMYPRWDSKVQRSLLFVADQLLHFVSIFLVVRFIVQYRYVSLIHQIVEKVLHHHGFSLNIEQAAVVILILIVLATSFSGVIVELIVFPVPHDGERLIETKHIAKENDASIERTYVTIPPAKISRGKVIGYLERLMTMLLIAAAGYSSIGFIIATKSLVRFKQLDDRDFAEYFLIGTLSSILLGTVWGFLLKTFIS